MGLPSTAGACWLEDGIDAQNGERSFHPISFVRFSIKETDVYRHAAPHRRWLARPTSALHRQYGLRIRSRHCNQLPFHRQRPEPCPDSLGVTILMTTFILARELGWTCFEKLAQQRALLVQSASNGPRQL